MLGQGRMHRRQVPPVAGIGISPPVEALQHEGPPPHLGSNVQGRIAIGVRRPHGLRLGQETVHTTPIVGPNGCT